MPPHVHLNRNLVLDRNREKRGPLNFEIGAGGRNDSPDGYVVASPGALKRDVRIVRALPCKLHFKISLDRCGVNLGLSKFGANHHYWKLGSARCLKPAQVAIGVARVEVLDRYTIRKLHRPFWQSPSLSLRGSYRLLGALGGACDRRAWTAPVPSGSRSA